MEQLAFQRRYNSTNQSCRNRSSFSVVYKVIVRTKEPSARLQIYVEELHHIDGLTVLCHDLDFMVHVYLSSTSCGIVATAQQEDEMQGAGRSGLQLRF